MSITKQSYMSSVIERRNPNILHSLPTLPFDIITEILSRLSVKLLLRLRCVCKSWSSLISDDPKFAKKHLTTSTGHSIYSIAFPGILTMYPPNFFFNTAVTTNLKHLMYRSDNCKSAMEIVGSCNGILCLAYKGFILLWNPSIDKSKDLPPLQKPHYAKMTYGFGYDSVIDNYKVVVVLWNNCGNFVEVKVNTLGTKIWKNIEEFPFGIVPVPDQKSGKYVSGTINWLTSSQHWSSPRLIVSLDLGDESYRKVLEPDYGEGNANSLTLDVLRDCLCILSGHDVWLMKEYGNKESWIKLFTISYKQDPSMLFFLKRVIYVFEDGQVLLQCKIPFYGTRLILYDPRIGTFKFVSFKKSLYDSRVRVSGLDLSKYGGLVICNESLISPYFYF